MSQACSSLPQVRLPAVAALLEEWLEHGIVPTEDIAFEHLLTELRQWPERAVPPMIEALVAGETTPLPLRAKAWELLLIRTGLQGVKRFRERIRKDLDAGRLGEFAWRELASLAEVAARNRLPVEIELTELARRVPKRFALERQRIWGALFDWHAANARIPSSHRWLLNEGVPQLEAELRECSQADTDVPWVWLEVFGECPEPILARLAETIIRLRDVLEPGVLAELMHNFSRHPKLLPADLIANAKDSEDSGLRTVGLELMLECDPGSLVASRESEPAIDKLLRETATNCGILFFNDRLYSPETASFVPYRGCNPK